MQAAERLLNSFRLRGIEPRIGQLRSRIRAYELHPEVTARAHERIVSKLRAMKLDPRTAHACAKAWLRNADFLLTDVPKNKFTHVVGNPPYVRWSKIPNLLRTTYKYHLSANVARGDLFLPFLDHALKHLRSNGTCGFLCSDRWKYMAFADTFRTKWLPLLDIVSNDRIAPSEAFICKVGVYPTILIANKRATPHSITPRRTAGSPRILTEQGCTIKVGPALGVTSAFVLPPDQDQVETQLLCPWIDSSEVLEGSIDWKGRHVVAMYNSQGSLINVTRFPGLAKHLEDHKPALLERSIVKNGAPWYRTIDRVRAADWQRPKLLIPGLARRPRIAIDRSGAIPSHGVYAIFVKDDRIDELYERLCDGRLATALAEIAPTVNGGYVRCYRRFLSMIRV